MAVRPFLSNFLPDCFFWLSENDSIDIHVLFVRGFSGAEQEGEETAKP